MKGKPDPLEITLHSLQCGVHRLIRTAPSL
jgi:hypothetical protein